MSFRFIEPRPESPLGAPEFLICALDAKLVLNEDGEVLFGVVPEGSKIARGGYVNSPGLLGWDKVDFRTATSKIIGKDTDVSQYEYEVLEFDDRQDSFEDIVEGMEIRSLGIEVPPQVGEAPLSGVEEVLEQRGNRYGEFRHNAALTQRLEKLIIAAAEQSGNELPPPQAEAMHMIVHKLARMACGDPTYIDNWVDIAGYATLVVNELED